MNGCILGGPPGFSTYEGFFSGMRGPREPLCVDTDGKIGLCQRLERLSGKPGYLFDEVCEDLIRTAAVKEVYTCGCEQLYVRYEICALKENCEWDGPYQLLTLWSREETLLSYTFVHGSGRHGVIGAMLYKCHGEKGCRRLVYDVDEVLQFVGKMADGDAVVVGNDECDGEFLMADSRDGRLMLTWQVFATPWMFNARKHVPVHLVRDAIRLFFERGILGIQALSEWEPAEDYDESSKLTRFVITRSLRRNLFRALRLDNTEEIKALYAFGVTVDGSVVPKELKVPFASYESMLEALHGISYADPRVLSEEDERRLRLFLALRGDDLAQCDLAYWWQEGESPFSIDLNAAEYWYLQAARKGNPMAQNNLANLYRLDTPLHDCKKAVFWHEQAASNKMPSAMLGLAECLCCPEWGSRDPERAAALREEAAQLILMKFNPDPKHIRIDYD